MSTNVLPDIPKFYTALAEGLACVVYILPLSKRFSRWKLAGTIGMGFFLQIAINYLAGLMHPDFWMGWMATAFAGMLLFLYMSCDLSLPDAGFFAIRAFILAEFAASLEWQIYIFFMEHGWEGDFWRGFFLVAIYGIVFSIMYLIERNHLQKNRKLHIRWKDLGNAILMGVIVFLMSNVSFVYQNTPFSGSMGREIFYIRTLVDLIGVVMLYAQLEMLAEGQLRRELENMDSLFRRQYEQYRLFQENDQIIKRMYHDLKHQIAMIRGETDSEKKNDYLKEMDQALRKYEAENKTGNSVLDTILSSKALYCSEHQINFTCMVDGTLLDFMEVMDICSIFGNALDNAIEYVEQLENPDKRMISISLYARQEFILLKFDNYYEASLTLEDGLPVTTKKEAQYHGYGLKSIRKSAEKYGGTLTVNGKDHWFSLCLLFPLQST